jgi:hypothetical protein
MTSAPPVPVIQGNSDSNALRSAIIGVLFLFGGHRQIFELLQDCQFRHVQRIIKEKL